MMEYVRRAITADDVTIFLVHLCSEEFSNTLVCSIRVNCCWRTLQQIISIYFLWHNTTFLKLDTAHWEDSLGASYKAPPKLKAAWVWVPPRRSLAFSSSSSATLASRRFTLAWNSLNLTQIREALTKKKMFSFGHCPNYLSPPQPPPPPNLGNLYHFLWTSKTTF